MGKLDKIQQSRKTVQERVQKEVEAAKKYRSMRQDPEQLRRNRQRSLEQDKSKKTIERSKASIESKVNLDDSLVDKAVAKHLEAKRRILEE